MTSEQGAARLGQRLPRTAAIVPIGDEPSLDPRLAIEALRAGGDELILCEGGPRLFGSLLDSGLIDELFLTLSPLVAGRGAAKRRLSLVEGVELLPARTLRGRLLTVRRAGSHLFLRYELPHRKCHVTFAFPAWRRALSSRTSLAPRTRKVEAGMRSRERSLSISKGRCPTSTIACASQHSTTGAPAPNRLCLLSRSSSSPLCCIDPCGNQFSHRPRCPEA